MPLASTERLSPRWLLALALLALAPRVANLGSFSMWLDEIIETGQASGSLARTWSELESDAVHPPLEGFLSWSLLHLGAGEVARRLVAVGLGVAAILLLAAWVARRFGRLEGILTGVFVALAPLHVHYSQELRPYSLALFFVALALVAGDRLLEHPGRLDPPRVALFALAVLGCFYSLYFAVLVLVPVGWLVLEAAFGPPAVEGEGEGSEGEARARARLLLRFSPLFALGWALAFLPWLAVLAAARGQRPQRPATRWHLAVLAKRFLDWTVGGGLGSPVARWGGVLALALLAIGLVRTARRPAGRAALAGALAGLLGVELLLHLHNHWSEPRYDLVGWLFLAVPFGLGLAALFRVPRAGWALGSLALGALAFAQGSGLWRDYCARPDWRWVGEVAHRLHGPDEPVFALNQSTRMCLAYYLDEVSGTATDPPWLITIDGDAGRLARAWPPDRSALLVGRVRTKGGALLHAAAAFPLAGRDEATGVIVRRLTPEIRRR